MWISEKLARFLGWDFIEVAGMTLTEILPPPNRIEVSGLLSNFRKKNFSNSTRVFPILNKKNTVIFLCHFEFEKVQQYEFKTIKIVGHFLNLTR